MLENPESLKHSEELKFGRPVIAQTNVSLALQMEAQKKAPSQHPNISEKGLNIMKRECRKHMTVAWLAVTAMDQPHINKTR